MSMEARMSLSYVSQEYLFCACAVLGKMALYDGIPIIPYLRSIVKHLPWKIPAYTKCCLCQPLYLNHPWGQRACWCIIRWYALSEHITYWVCTNLIYLFISSFCMNFVFKISQKRNQQTCSNFHTILPMIRNRPANKFSLITQPWHHPGANLCFHIIIHIFITIYHKLIKFNTHKLQVMGQHIDPSTPPCASRCACARASKLKNAQNHNLNNGEHVSGHFEHFKISCPYVSKFSHDLDSRCHNWQFPLISVTLNLL